jgi:competence protein ComFC
MILSKILHALIGTIYPQSCALCGTTSLVAGIPMCSKCENRLFAQGMQVKAKKDSKGFDKAYFVLSYQGDAKKLVQNFKIQKPSYLIPLFQKCFLNFIKRYPLGSKYEALVPIPPQNASRSKSQENPTLLLSKLLSPVTNAPIVNLLARDPIKPMKKQSSLSKEDRKLNVKGAFCVKREPRGLKKVLLVDDVYTTGATATECARILKKAGIDGVDLLACARQP